MWNLQEKMRFSNEHAKATEYDDKKKTIAMQNDMPLHTIAYIHSLQIFPLNKCGIFNLHAILCQHITNRMHNKLKN